MQITHRKKSLLPDDLNTDLILNSDWNDTHVLLIEPSDDKHTHVVGEFPTRTSPTIYQTLNPYINNSIAVYLNGLREGYITPLSETEFEFAGAIDTKDIVMVDYILKYE